MSDSHPNDGRPTARIDIEAPDYAQGWEATFKDLRARCPMIWSTEHGGYWIATSYKDVLQIAQDDATFTSGKTVDPVTGAIDGGVALPPMPSPRVVPVETDREEWTGFRGLINRALGPKASEARRARVREFADILIDRVIERGSMDVVQDLTSPLTALVTMEIIGFPLDQWRQFADPFHELVYLNKSSPEFPAAVAAMQWCDQRILDEIEQCRLAPRDDLLSHLTHARIDDLPVADIDIQRIISNVMSGGVDTTNALTAHSIMHLWRHPDQRARLVADRSLLPIAREEFIRFFSPVHGTARTTRAARCIGGQMLQPGERVLLLYASANRDEEIFDNGDEIDITRFPNRHIGFGAGMHRCVGSFLARIMYEEMMDAIFERLPDYEVVESEAVLYPSISPINGWVNMSITFAPGPRLSLLDPEWVLGSSGAVEGRHGIPI
jgi:cytochrome P450